MALSDDEKKKALAAAAKSSSTKSAPTMSGKPAYKTGGSNPLGTRKVGTTSMPPAKTKAVSPVMVQPSKPMGKDPSGSANFNRTAPSRATITAGPAKLPVGGKTTKSTGGRNLTGYEEKTQSNPNAKIAAGPFNPVKGTTLQNNSNPGWNKSNNVAVLATTGTVGLGIGLAKGKKIVEKVKQAARYIGDTKERRAARKQQNAENEAELTRRKAEQEAKNPTTKPAKIKASRHTMKNIKRLKKQD